MHHQSTRVSTFQFHQRVTERRKVFRRRQTHDGDRSPDVSDTRSHCFQSTRENSTVVRTSQSARRDFKTRLAFHRVRGGQEKPSLVLRRVRGWTKQRILHSSKCTRDTDSHCSERADTNFFTAELRYTRIRSTTPKRMTMNDANNAALFLMG